MTGKSGRCKRKRKLRRIKKHQKLAGINQMLRTERRP